MEFDGQDDFIECPDRPALNPLGAWSICTWVRASSWVHPRDAADYIVSKDDWKNGARGYVLRFAAAGQPDFTIGVGNNWSEVRDRTPRPLNAWVHLAAVFDGRRKVLFVNGEEKGVHEERRPIAASKFALRLGRGAFDPNRRFHGTIDELALFDIPLTADDIRQVYELGQSGTPLAR
jgi:hypothetical protein